VHRSQRLLFILSQLIQYKPLHSISPRLISISNFHQRLGLPNGLFPSGFPIETLYASPIHTTCPNQLILDSITEIISEDIFYNLFISLAINNRMYTYTNTHKQTHTHTLTHAHTQTQNTPHNIAAVPV
jgi:hypothetical protein